MKAVDCVVVGAGAAGLFCAGIAGQLGQSVLLLDHWPKLAEKIRISGGGRCNFTNRDSTWTCYLSDNPQFCRSALARYTPADFLDLMRRHGLTWHEKHKGQLFCNEGSGAIIDMLATECAAGSVERRQPCKLQAVRPLAPAESRHSGAERAQSPSLSWAPRYEIDTDGGTVRCRHLVVATGGLSIPKIGASDYALRLARQFDLDVIAPRPGLVPLAFDAAAWAPFAALAGVAVEARVGLAAGAAITDGGSRAAPSFVDDLLFTHQGLSGPAILQISSYWQPGATLAIDLAPALERDALRRARPGSRKSLARVLAQHLPERLALALVAAAGLDAEARLADLSNAELARVEAKLFDWRLQPSGSLGWRKAEVTCGGVDTRALDSRSMQVRSHPGLYFIGEAVDVTGWLGGYNFQWAWASAHACARAMAAEARAQAPSAS